MKKIYLIFFTLILGAMVIPKAQAQMAIEDCVNPIEVNAADNTCSAYVNFDDPGCSGCLALGAFYEYELSGATVDTIYDSQYNFNTGVTDVLAILWDTAG
ncbi:MAG TPA: hypothetical protein VJ919_15440, partial [Tangfeifania sp.]|nr:hypothetical protein [Tangfeifania sp.]